MADTGTRSIEIFATPQRILEVVQDVEAYPTWMDAFKKADVIAKDDQGRPQRASFAVDARIKTIDYTLEYSYGENRISWKKVGGDVKEITGSYALEGREASTLVSYEYSIDPGFPVPGFLRKQGVNMMVNAALDSLKERAES
ncbi:MAG: SRPBCC family protein [Actinomycetota bacterium]|nr:SRPBCC family protein [Actinomycetota bacterium]